MEASKAVRRWGRLGLGETHDQSMGGFSGIEPTNIVISMRFMEFHANCRGIMMEIVDLVGLQLRYLLDLCWIDLITSSTAQGGGGSFRIGTL